jgi:hypothetical protein
MFSPGKPLYSCEVMSGLGPGKMRRRRDKLIFGYYFTGYLSAYRIQHGGMASRGALMAPFVLRLERNATLSGKLRLVHFKLGYTTTGTARRAFTLSRRAGFIGSRNRPLFLRSTGGGIAANIRPWLEGVEITDVNKNLSGARAFDSRADGDRGFAWLVTGPRTASSMQPTLSPLSKETEFPHRLPQRGFIQKDTSIAIRSQIGKRFGQSDYAEYAQALADRAPVMERLQRAEYRSCKVECAFQHFV